MFTCSCKLPVPDFLSRTWKYPGSDKKGIFVHHFQKLKSVVSYGLMDDQGL